MGNQLGERRPEGRNPLSTETRLPPLLDLAHDRLPVLLRFSTFASEMNHLAMRFLVFNRHVAVRGQPVQTELERSPRQPGARAHLGQGRLPVDVLEDVRPHRQGREPTGGFRLLLELFRESGQRLGQKRGKRQLLSCRSVLRAVTRRP